VHYTTSCKTQSSAPEDGRNNRLKHVEVIGIINKPLLLHLVCVYIIYINDARSSKYQISERNSNTATEMFPYLCRIRFLRLQQIQCNSRITPRSATTETGQAM
jgi:hypothetical protein